MPSNRAVERRSEIVDVYRRITKIIWQRLAPTFGSRTINAIARNVIARRAQQHPALHYLKVPAEGLSWSELEAHLEQVPLPELRAMLDLFVDDFFEALSNLIGKLVVGKIFKEAEAEVRRGGRR